MAGWWKLAKRTRWDGRKKSRGAVEDMQAFDLTWFRICDRPENRRKPTKTDRNRPQTDPKRPHGDLFRPKRPQITPKRPRWRSWGLLGVAGLARWRLDRRNVKERSGRLPRTTMRGNGNFSILLGFSAMADDLWACQGRGAVPCFAPRPMAFRRWFTATAPPLSARVASPAGSGG